MSRPITPATSLETLKKEARRWLNALESGDAAARARLLAAVPDAPADPTLRDVQHALARELGLPGWAALKRRLGNTALLRYESVASALVAAYGAPDPDALRTVWDYFGHMRTWEVMRRYVRLDLGGPEEVQDGARDFITIQQARWLVARAQGFATWDELAAHTDAIPPGTAALPKPVGGYLAGEREPLESPDTYITRNWDDLLDAMEERGLTAVHGGGQVTDDVLERISRLEQVEELDLGSSRTITGDGLRHLARMARLRVLLLGGTAVDDEAMAVIGTLPRLERLVLSWTRVTDAGAAHLAGCPTLRSVDLSGTATGDGALRALGGKPDLRDFRSGNEVTDAGLAQLRDWPAFRTWSAIEGRLGLFTYLDQPNQLQLRGRFGDAGLAHLAALEGLYALDLHSDRLAVTGAGLVPLAALPHFEWLAFDPKDADMRFIAALPHLRHLMCQDTAAGDDGFAALARSRSLEHLWGRRCHNLRRRGFTALAGIPTLKSLSVSCLNVDDEGLSALPRFPVLTELMPMDVPDEGYRHVGRCAKLESLVLMYCRESGDRATEHITGLPLRKYFASYNRITDRTPELLSGMDSLENITFDTCAGLTDRGVAALARLPRLRKLGLSGMGNVTGAVVRAFGDGVEVRWRP
jgi:hypothetical protein